MNYADVLINLPATALNRVFTYAIPEKFKGEVEFGQRVLVEFGQNSIEAYVIAVKNESAQPGVKNIVHILDPEPVINEELLELAYFVADNYLCPVVKVLHVIVPKALTKSKAQVIIPLIKREEYENNPARPQHNQFLNQLWQDKEITLTSSRQHISAEDLDFLVAQGIVKVINKYTKKLPQREGYVYTLAVPLKELDLLKLSKRAPRQAEIIQVLAGNDVSCERLDKEFNKTTITALLDKGWISKKLTPTIFFNKNISLTAEQSKAITTVNNALGKGYREFLLFGVTGSGKTEVYINIAQQCIVKGRNVLMLIPEIALTRHLVQVIRERINNIAVLHSNMSKGERLEEWKRIRNGEVNLVLGTRSAVFAPIPNLGLIIIDEEQEGTYKQEETPKYDAREVAKRRAAYHKALILYGSATPSLDLFYRVQNQEVSLLTLESRIGEATLPQVYIEDLKSNFSAASPRVLSANLQEKIKKSLANQEQIILFINRRGYSPITICRKCGAILTCPRCSVGMTYHKDLQANICHYCNYTISLSRSCPQCNNNYLQQVGTGTQKVEEEVRGLFPGARVERLDLDVSRKGLQQELLTKMKNKDVDILIGTQMVAKGLDFPNVSLVGIIDIDNMLALPDFRAAERAFQLMVQAAGRAGRANKAGEVVIQTYNPDNPLFDWAAEQDYVKFYFEELKQRRILNYPPFSSLLRIVVSSANVEKVKSQAGHIAQLINEALDAKEDYLQILGPAPCPIQKIRNKFRYQIIVKGDNMLLLKSLGFYISTEVKFINGKIDIDINPNTML